MKKHILILMAFYGLALNAQENLEGRVLAKDGNETIPLIGANVFWNNTQTGTVTNEEGKFTLPYLGPEEYLILSYIGYKSDTLSVKRKPLTHSFFRRK